jgi:hypothetical protein
VRNGFAAALCGVFLSATSSFAALISWADWTAATAGLPGSASATITLPDASTIGVSYAGEVRAGLTRINNSYPSWLPAATFSDGAAVNNAPPFGDLVGIIGGAPSTNTITFSTAVTDPVMAIWSLGQPGAAASFVFTNATPTFVSGGPSQEFNGQAITLSGNTVNGAEGNGVVQFHGTFTSLSWTNPSAENYYGFTLGVAGRGVVPEPGTYAMLLAGLAVVVLLGRTKASFA